MKKTSRYERHKEREKEEKEIAEKESEYSDKRRDFAEKIKKKLEKIDDKELLNLWGQYHIQNLLLGMADVAISSSMSMVNNIMFEKILAHHNLACLECSEILVPDGHFSEDKDASEQDKIYAKEFTDKPQEKFTEKKNQFVCLECGKIYGLKLIGEVKKYQ